MKKIFSLFLLISLAVFSGCAGDEKKDKKETEDVTYVQAEEVKARDFQDDISFAGIIKPCEEAMLCASVSGNVEKVSVDIGSKVKENDVLCKIDDLTYKMLYEKALTVLNTEKVAFAESQKDFARKKTLYEAQAISKMEYEGAETQLKIGEESLKRAQGDFTLAEKNLIDTEIKAPLTGTVSYRSVSRGEAVQPGQPIFGVVNTEKVYIETGISEEYIARVKEEQKVLFEVEAYKDQLFEGSITNIGPVPDNQTKTYPIKILVDNSDGRLKAGMFASVTIIAESHEDVPAVPQKAVLSEGGNKYVFIVKDGTAKKINILLGFSDGQYSEVTRGITVGDMVIIKGNTKLKDGDRIEIR